ncbi:glycoside hydrolase family 92 protein [Whalleya microplaca]|nr:glycoside hydrolase family 92 protein [Whalleya microplaca]
MRSSGFCLASILLLGAGTVYGDEEAFDPLAYVDQLIGSRNGGNIFPGATVPYGMAKAVADTNSSSNQGGFTLDDSPVSGFSAMHDSGTGGSPSLGNFPLFPYASCPGDDIDRCDFPKKARVNHGYFSNRSVGARPGYFAITLNSGVEAEMTASQHAALFRFTFPATNADGNVSHPLILQDLSDLSDSRQDNGSISIDAKTGRITGDGRFQASFSAGQYVVYFCTDFSGPQMLDNGIFVNSRASTDVKNLTISRSINGYPLPGGAFVRFESADMPVLARVGLSFLSTKQACTNAETEIPEYNFDQIQKAAANAWKQKLSPITVSSGGVDDDFLRNFYSGIYRTMVNPQNYTGENPFWDNGEPYFDSFYCLWDSFRSQIPFLTILDPASVAQMIRSLIDTYRYEGWLPDCRMTFSKGYTQSGSNADVILADGFLKGIKNDIDWDAGYEAVVKDAEVEPFDWSSNGRGGLDSWKALGYIPVQDFDYKGFGTMTRSISRTLEYSYNDFTISQMAKGRNNSIDTEKYLDSSENWKNLYKNDQTSNFSTGVDTGFVGFFQPKFLNGTWDFQDPLLCSNIDYSGASCSLQNTAHETFESSIWEYNFFVPHNQGDLISLYGGPTEFVRRLDFLHDQNITYIGNEPAFLTAKRSHFYIPRYFSTTPDGLPGNDDSGAMGSFVAFSMMGLFPNPGQDVYLITPPFFESINITSPYTGKTATIRNVNFDPTYDAIYIQSATLNGEQYTRNWIDHSFFTEGKELVLTLGKNESSWGTAVKDLPPSVGEYLGFNKTLSMKRALRHGHALKFPGDFGRGGLGLN